MRKKLEVQPPSLPDLTMELTTRPSLTNPRSDSPSVSSSDESSVLPGEVRALLGVTGTILTDVVQIILEYGRVILGADFPSLLHYAHHLVTNAYVATRSRHAISLVAHLTSNSISSSSLGNMPSSSVATASASLSSILLTPSAAAAGAFAEVIQRGTISFSSFLRELFKHIFIFLTLCRRIWTNE